MTIPRRKQWWRSLAKVGRTLLIVTGTIVSIVFTFLGLLYKRSLDIPWFNNVRLGFFGNRGPAVWQCSEGHSHYSLPFWLGALFSGGVAFFLWFRSSKEPIK